MIRDAWRLALGTLTAVPVGPPVEVDRRRAGLAMVIAPLAALPLGLVAGAIVFGGIGLEMPPLVVALLAVGAVILGNRAFHLDGLSDVIDGMAASYDRERSLAVMKSGTSGPAGVVAVLLVVGLQVAGLATLIAHGTATVVSEVGGLAEGSAYSSVLRLEGGADLALAARTAVLAGVVVALSRAALALCCARGIRPAREDGLGRLYTQTVPRMVAVAIWLLGAVVLAVLADWTGLDWWRGALAAGIAFAVVAVLIARAVKRFGGVTGDVFGAAVELTLAALLVVLA